MTSALGCRSCKLVNLNWHSFVFFFFSSFQLFVYSFTIILIYFDIINGSNIKRTLLVTHLSVKLSCECFEFSVPFCFRVDVLDVIKCL